MAAEPLALSIFKQYWAEMATPYSITNNDAALMFRAITELVLLPHSSLHPTPPTATTEPVGDRIEKVVSSFPKDLAPLCRDLAKVCIETLHPVSSTTA